MSGQYGLLYTVGALDLRRLRTHPAPNRVVQGSTAAVAVAAAAPATPPARTIIPLLEHLASLQLLSLLRFFFARSSA